MAGMHSSLELRGKSSKGKELVRQFGSSWDIIGEDGPNVVIVSPPTSPTYIRAVRRIGDSNFHVTEARSSS
jgi:hypothetical protein